MDFTHEQLLVEALKLPVPDRTRLMQHLLESLERDDPEDGATVEQAWHEEIGRRVAEHRAGNIHAIPAEEVFAQARVERP